MKSKVFKGMHMKKFSVLVIFLTTLLYNSAYAQVKADGKWYFPDSVKSMCVNYEQHLVSLFKKMIEQNREWVDPNSKTDKSYYSQLDEAVKKGISETELSWERLGCSSILYSGKK